MRKVKLSRLEEILKTVNTRAVKEIIVSPGTCHSPNRFEWCDITIGTQVYSVWLADMETFVWKSNIKALVEMLDLDELPCRPVKFEYTMPSTTGSYIFVIG